MLKQEKIRNAESDQPHVTALEGRNESELMPGRTPSKAFLAALKAVEDTFGD